MTPRAAATLTAVLVAATPAFAHVPPAREAPGALVSVSVEIDGHTSPLYRAPDGSGRLYVEAHRGAGYTLRIANRTGERLGVLIAVDGLNVVSGEREPGPGLSGAHPGRMYVLDPWDESVIRGWRTSLDEVRRFTFVDERASYASRSGQANGKMGWIEAWVYRERPWVRHEEPWDRVTRAPVPRDEEAARKRPDDPEAQATAPPEVQGKAAPESRAADGLSQRDREQGYPGTGWGAPSQDPATVVRFDALPRPSDAIVVRYEYARALQTLGIWPLEEARDRLRQRERGEGFARPPAW